MPLSILRVIAAGVILFCTSTMHAQTTIYSFESPAVNPDGFGPNGGGVTVSQDTIGATAGANSLKVSIVQGATFVGALTGNLDPAFGNPPGVNHILFDLTIASGQEFTGAFGLVGVTIFGASQPDYPGGQQFGLQAQFSDFENIGGKAAGTYHDIQIDLASATNPLTFAAGQSFDQIFGSGANQLIPTGFEFFFNKSNDAGMTAYIDNVRLYPSPAPEPTTFGLLGLGAAMIVALRKRGR
jgi:PEP-CTERM motif